MPKDLAKTGTYQEKENWKKKKRADYIAQIAPAKQMAGTSKARFWAAPPLAAQG
jgi:hypothetical protein